MTDTPDRTMAEQREKLAQRLTQDSLSYHKFGSAELTLLLTALARRLEMMELRLLRGDQHDRGIANEIGCAAHFLRQSAVPATETWQDIATAPRDGTKIDL